MQQQWDVRDHYHALFNVSYGLVWSGLEDHNVEAKCRTGEGVSKNIIALCLARLPAITTLYIFIRERLTDAYNPIPATYSI